MDTLTSCWYCEEGECDKIFDKSAVDEIMEQQKIIFDGFMRLRSNQDYIMIPSDIINLCMKFFIIDIKSSFQYDMDAIDALIETFKDNGEYFIAYKISQILLSIHPEQSELHCDVGRILSRWGVEDDAEHTFKKAIELNPDDNYSRHVYGHSLYKNKKYELAIEQLQKAIELKNDDALSMSECARCYVALDDFNNAQKYYQQAIDTAPTNIFLRREYGICLQKQGNHIDALIQLNKKLKHDPEDLDIIKECISSYLELKNFQKAGEYYLKAIEVNKDEKSKYCLYYATFLWQKLEDYENAQKYYLKAIAVDDGKTSRCYECYALFLCENIGDLKNSAIYYMKAMEIEPMNYKIYYGYAMMLRDYVKDYNESEKYYLKALELNDKGDGINSAYGYLLYLMGDYEKAMKYVVKELGLSHNEGNIWANLYHYLGQ